TQVFPRSCRVSTILQHPPAWISCAPTRPTAVPTAPALEFRRVFFVRLTGSLDRPREPKAIVPHPCESLHANKAGTPGTWPERVARFVADNRAARSREQRCAVGASCSAVAFQPQHQCFRRTAG